MDATLLSFSFLQGVLAFFAPCAVALLPGYLSSFVTRAADNKAPVVLLIRAIYLALWTIAGIVLTYAVMGGLLLAFAQVVKSSLVYVSIILGVLVIIMGIYMMLGKSVSLNLHGPNFTSKNKSLEALVFGIAYGIGALGCLFPLFLVVSTAALQAPSSVVGASYILAYIVGMSLFMFIFYIVAVFARQFLQKSLQRVMPWILRIGGFVIVVAGIYIIWYQSALL